MSSFFLSLLIAACAAGIAYFPALRRTGSNVQSSLVVAAVVGLVVFIVAITLIKVS